MSRLNLLNRKFGCLLVTASAGTNPQGRPQWKCLCSLCGKTKNIDGYSLTRRGRSTKSCGCQTNKIHGYATSIKMPEYRAWAAMKTRCYNPKSDSFSYYGGRGIQVCDRWLHSFENFLADVGKRPSPKHSLDRYPNTNGNYEPGNCRWATKHEQALNRRKKMAIESFSNDDLLGEVKRRSLLVV